MGALAKSIAIKHVLSNEVSVPVLAAKKIYKGALLSCEVTAGYFEPLVDEDKFRGLAIEEVDNTSGANGAVNVRILNGKIRIQTAIAATVAQAEGKTAVYAVSDNIADLTYTAGSHQPCGYVVGRDENGHAIVELDTHIA